MLFLRYHISAFNLSYFTSTEVVFLDVFTLQAEPSSPG